MSETRRQPHPEPEAVRGGVALEDRVFGLDLIRGGAILCVLLCHGIQITLQTRFPQLETGTVLLGFFSAEFFFVLSGYLIGGMLIRHLERGQSLLGFWIRRWFRTLPLFYLFLLINWLISRALGTPTDGLPRFFVFAQNLISPHPIFFGAAWTLSLEEWFYLCFPLLVMAFRRNGRELQQSLRLALLLTLFAGLVIRGAYVVAANPSWDAGVRKIVAFRLDAILYGVVGAYFERYWRATWRKRAKLAAWLGLFMLAAVGKAFCSLPIDSSLFARIFLFPLLSFGILLLFPALTGWQRSRWLFAPLIQSLSITSYSLYLCHWCLIIILTAYQFELRAMSLDTAILALCAFVWASCVIGRWVHSWFEAPMTELRELFPSARREGMPGLTWKDLPRLWAADAEPGEAVPGSRRMLAVCFGCSGFAALLYQTCAIRLAFLQFGALTFILSAVVSIFLLGLGAGSQLAGRFARNGRISRPFRTYAQLEAVVALAGCLFPFAFPVAGRMVASARAGDSLEYLAFSWLAIAAVLLLPCFAMGAAFPIAVSALGKTQPGGFRRLYRANLIGAAVGVFLPTFVLIEVIGFRSTFFVGAAANAIACLVGFTLSRKAETSSVSQDGARQSAATAASSESGDVHGGRPAVELVTDCRILLFFSGFASMAMEVVWTRMCTPISYTSVYAFAILLGVYLLANSAGAGAYHRSCLARSVLSVPVLVGLAGAALLVPILALDPRQQPNGSTIVLAVFPISFLFGYLTTLLADAYAGDEPDRLGEAFWMNSLGCFTGALTAGYLLLPQLGTFGANVLVAGLCGFAFLRQLGLSSTRRFDRPLALTFLCFGALFFKAVSDSETFENPSRYGAAKIRRDYAATVISSGEGRASKLIVNGIGITEITPITKLMAHLPLVFLGKERPDVLVICLGMGTTFRSAMSWGGRVTAVELVPSVVDAFGEFFADAPELLRNPRGLVVVDDGRRYLVRDQSTYDVITLDPPPPVFASGSGMLYSTEFYETAKARLKPGGLLQQWYPGEPDVTLQGVVGALRQSFRFIRVFRPIDGRAGFHFLASDSPLSLPAVERLDRSIPAAAKQDLIEWSAGSTAPGLVSEMLAREVRLESILTGQKRVLTDDFPLNEYFFLRSLR